MKVFPGIALIIVASTLAATGCGGAPPNGGDLDMLLPQAIGDWEREGAPVTYDRETIFDYINGAGEVYRSFGFTHVFVERYENPAGEGLTVEVFDMGSAEDAFGVFSYARESEEEGIGSAFERKGSILCFWQDRYYVCVAAEQRDAGPVLEEVARGLSANLPPPGNRPALMDGLPSPERIPASDRFFHTHQSLNYHYYLARENVLHLSEDTDVALARYRPGSTYLLMILYPDDGAAAEGLRSFRAQITPEAAGDQAVPRENGLYSSSSRSERTLIVVIDAESAETAENLRDAALETAAALHF